MNVAIAPQMSVALDPITVEVIGASLSSIVEQMDATTLLLHGQHANIDQFTNLVVENDR